MTKNNYPNWFTITAQTPFSKYLGEFKDKQVDFLQIGAYTGDATLWLFENILTNQESTLTDVDTWEGSDEVVHKKMDWDDVETVYNSRTEQFIEDGRLIKIKNTSNNFFSTNNNMFDFIYVDGDHTAMAVLKDGLSAFNYLKPGGVLAFDDYTWSEGSGDIMRDPKPAVDAFLLFHKKNISVIEIGSQVWLRKNA